MKAECLTHLTLNHKRTLTQKADTHEQEQMSAHHQTAHIILSYTPASLDGHTKTSDVSRQANVPGTHT